MLAANLTPELFGIMKPAKLEITFPIRRARDYGGEKNEISGDKSNELILN